MAWIHLNLEKNITDGTCHLAHLFNALQITKLRRRKGTRPENSSFENLPTLKTFELDGLPYIYSSLRICVKKIQALGMYSKKKKEKNCQPSFKRDLLVINYLVPAMMTLINTYLIWSFTWRHCFCLLPRLILSLLLSWFKS